MEALIALLAIGFVSAIGSYFGSYLRKKGENVATKEDISILVAEHAEIRNALQRIEHEVRVKQQS